MSDDLLEKLATWPITSMVAQQAIDEITLLRDAAQTEKVPVARPVAFRVQRVIDDKLSKTEFRLFDDEDEARRAACDIGADYDGLYLVADRRAAFFAQPDPAQASWECMGRKQSLPEPGECNWPDCGCDPHATKVIEALLEQGWGRLPVTSTLPRTPETHGEGGK